MFVESGHATPQLLLALVQLVPQRRVFVIHDGGVVVVGGVVVAGGGVVVGGVVTGGVVVVGGVVVGGVVVVGGGVVVVGGVVGGVVVVGGTDEATPKFNELWKLVTPQGLAPPMHQVAGNTLRAVKVLPALQAPGRPPRSQDVKRKLRAFPKYVPLPAPPQDHTAPLPEFRVQVFQVVPPLEETETLCKAPESPTLENAKAGHQGSH